MTDDTLKIALFALELYIGDAEYMLLKREKKNSAAFDEDQESREVYAELKERVRKGKAACVEIRQELKKMIGK